jgi:hypothetical protein
MYVYIYKYIMYMKINVCIYMYIYISRTPVWSREKQMNKSNRQIYFSASGQDLMTEGDSCIFPFSDSDLHRCAMF